MEIHQKKLIEAAQKLGIEIEQLEHKWQIDAVRLRHADKSTLVLFGRVFSHLNYIADAIAASKIASTAMMAELGIPVPNSYSFSSEHINRQKLNDFQKEHKCMVVKPMQGTDGKGIAMHLTNTGQIIRHIQQFSAPKGQWLLEEQVQGHDLRLQCLSGRLIAACIRKPCTLVGDGKSTISHLIKQRNKLIQTQNPENSIDIDHQVNRRLAEAKFTFETVLPNRQELQIKDVSNMAQGGHAIDVTPQVHPTYKHYLNKLSNSLNIKFFSLDVMTTSPEADPATHSHALEFNAQSAWLHHTFSEVRQHDIATLILEDYFDLTKEQTMKAGHDLRRSRYP